MNTAPDISAKRILVMAPETLVGPHFEACIVVADILASAGHQVSFLGCYDQNQRCVFQDSEPTHPRFSTRVEHISCAVCISQFASIVASRGFKAISPDEFHLDDVESIHRGLASRVRTEGLGARTPEINFGLLAAASLLLINKTSLGSPLTAPDWDYYERMAFTLLQRQEFVARAIHATDADVVMVFGQYAQNMAALCAACNANIIPVILDQPLNGSVDRNRILARSTTAITKCYQLHDSWRNSKSSLKHPELDNLLQGLSTTFSGKSPWAYSPPITGSNLNTAAAARARRTIVAFTSSLDEIESSSLLSMGFNEDGHTKLASVYADQIAWLVDLNELCETHDDIEIIVRVHPRTGKEERSGIGSRHLEGLRERAMTLHKLKFVWPQDAVSSYDLMLNADVVTVSWSSIGIEAAVLGIPVVSAWYSNSTFPADSFILTPRSAEAYKAALVSHESVNIMQPVEQIYRALDYLAFTRFRTSFNLGGESDANTVHLAARASSRMNPFGQKKYSQSVVERFVGYLFATEGVGRNFDETSVATGESVTALSCARAILALLSGHGVPEHSLVLRRLQTAAAQYA